VTGILEDVEHQRHRRRHPEVLPVRCERIGRIHLLDVLVGCPDPA
jgi:hypothetical protein